jgi:hypothetical protein
VPPCTVYVRPESESLDRVKLYEIKRLWLEGQQSVTVLLCLGGAGATLSRVLTKSGRKRLTVVGDFNRLFSKVVGNLKLTDSDFRRHFQCQRSDQRRCYRECGAAQRVAYQHGPGGRQGEGGLCSAAQELR